MELPWLRCPEPPCRKGAGGEKEKQGVIAGEPVPPSLGSQPQPAPQGDAGVPRAAQPQALPSPTGRVQTTGTVGYGSLALADPPQPSTSSLGPPAPGHQLPPAASSWPVALVPCYLLPQQPQDPPLRSAPSSRPAPCQDHRQQRPWQLCRGCRPTGRGEKEGKGSSRGVCVCARGCVCVHKLTEGLSPRLAGAQGEKERAT